MADDKLPERAQPDENPPKGLEASPLFNENAQLGTDVDPVTMDHVLSDRAGSASEQDDEATKEELLEEAREKNIEGRSSMNKEELQKALKKS